MLLELPFFLISVLDRNTIYYYLFTFYFFSSIYKTVCVFFVQLEWQRIFEPRISSLHLLSEIRIML
jgi:hypothetical protein